MQLEKSYSLLWIEDDFDRLKNLVRPLLKKGFKVDHVTNLESYCEKQNLQKYDLFIVDLMIPQKKRNGDITEFDPYPGIQILKNLIDLNKPILVLSIVTDTEIMKTINKMDSSIKILRKGNVFPSDFKYEIYELLGIEESADE
ncbi:response regulator [Desulfobacula phenolica]|uniref:Response regulator receiver domain-containing protein n=1 Tax=Desulfobacula phenolica TaxID=90732 RepID=A0A1H2KBL6_9BACT|nr:hypothetical protein [Desulfobacula phenolica]SDU65861.1 hypothetical protein SAMN04487931_1287 [Desulfobacula phenolica]